MGDHHGDIEAFLAGARAETDRILARGRERFDAVSDGTLGIEEEFALVDPQTLSLTPAYERLRELADSSGRGEIMTGELIASEAEFRTGVCVDIADAAAQVVDRREAGVSWAHEAGVRLGATGTHPWSDYRDQVIVPEPYYERLVDRMGYVARRNNTFGLHVHCAIQGADRAIAVADAVRTWLPAFLALSASSPYIDGRDSGLHSARSLSFSRTFPRANVPPAFATFAAYDAFVRDLAATGSIDTYGQLWWGVRPHSRHGTVEVRSFEAQPDACRTIALAALTQGVLLALADDADAGSLAEPLPTHLIEENMWRATRGGLDAQFVDWHSAPVVTRPMRDLVAELRARASAAGEHRGLNAEWALAGIDAILDQGNSTDIQRARTAEVGVEGMYREIVEMTETSSDLLSALAGVRQSR